MRDAAKFEAPNEVTICGQLNELNINEYTTKDGKPFISGTAEVISDQTINGVPTQTRTIVHMSASRYKKDGNPNKVFDIIKEYPNQFTSVAAADSPEQASWVSFSKAKLSENIWIDQSGNERTGFQISGNFMNKKKPEEKETAHFNVTGYIFKIDDEIGKDGEATGRLKLTVGVVGYGGRISRIEMFAEGAAKGHIEVNWNPKDTINIVGRVNMIQKTETYTEAVGFGEPIEKTRTIYKKELIVTGGSQYGLDEEEAYDEDSIRQACANRLALIEDKKVKAKEKAAKTATKSSVSDLGF